MYKLIRKKIYDELYEEACKLMQEYNPCNVSDGTCQREKIGASTSFCCHNCKYITKSGCRGKALYCKLWTCTNIEHLLPKEFKIKQRVLLTKAFNNRLLIFRGAKKDISKFNKNTNIYILLEEICNASNMGYYEDNNNNIIIFCGIYNTNE